MTNEEIEKYIIGKLPATFGQIVATLPGGQHGEYYRQVDKGLQRLRKRKLIEFERFGNRIEWKERK